MLHPSTVGKVRNEDLGSLSFRGSRRQTILSSHLRGKNVAGQIIRGHYDELHIGDFSVDYILVVFGG